MKYKTLMQIINFKEIKEKEILKEKHLLLNIQNIFLGLFIFLRIIL